MKRFANMRSGAVLQVLFLGLFTIGVITAVSAARLPHEAKKKQRQLEEAYSQTIAGEAPTMPFAKSDVAVAGKIIYPRLRKSYVVVTTGTEEALKAGPSLIPGAAPIGKPGVSFISAHRETHFAFLRHARAGDTIQAAGADGTMRDYRVTKTEVVDIDDLSAPASPGENRLVLFTCYPFQSFKLDDRRFAVHAELID